MVKLNRDEIEQVLHKYLLIRVLCWKTSFSQLEDIYCLFYFELFSSIYAVLQNLVLYADMWPAPHWTPGGGGYGRNPLRQDSKANKIEENSRIQTTTPSFGSVLQAPGIPIEDY